MTAYGLRVLLLVLCSLLCMDMACVAGFCL